ncbi:MAG: threonine--tRNA ligase, partial [Planctomycetaceae bacterium]|nr:threonine--tRNA ligase [Planctomycetaceae bacterium]
FPPMFGNAGGAVVDHWITELKEGRLKSDEESKLIELTRMLGVEIPEYQVSQPVEQKLAALKAWQGHQERYLLKPMNCPHHAQIYKSAPRSYRDLPVRLAEFGTVYRHEQSGELNGLLRVRGLTQDDAHLFCTPDQVEEEFRSTVGLVQFVLQSLGLDDYRVQLSLRDPKSDKYVGSEENWQRAEA